LALFQKTKGISCPLLFQTVLCTIRIDKLNAVPKVAFRWP